MRKKLSLLFMALFLFMGVPQMAQAAEYPYEVEVNLTQNVVTVYKKDAAGNYTVPDRAFVCSVGPATPTGTFRTTDKYVWRALFGNVYGQYATRITGSILFHSVPYYTMYDKGSLEYLEYNKLGTSASMGCVRLTVENAKWIYDNCPAGTTVRMVKNNNPLPIQPEQPQKLDVNDTKLRGWDPTDPDPANPWHKVLPDNARMESINVKSPRSSLWRRHLLSDGRRCQQSIRSAGQDTDSACFCGRYHQSYGNFPDHISGKNSRSILLYLRRQNLLQTAGFGFNDRNRYFLECADRRYCSF